MVSKLTNTDAQQRSRNCILLSNLAIVGCCVLSTCTLIIRTLQDRVMLRTNTSEDAVKVDARGVRFRETTICPTSLSHSHTRTKRYIHSRGHVDDNYDPAPRCCVGNTLL